MGGRDGISDISSDEEGAQRASEEPAGSGAESGGEDMSALEWYEVGREHMREGAWEEAADCLSKACELKMGELKVSGQDWRTPECGDYHIWYGDALLKHFETSSDLFSSAAHKQAKEARDRAEERRNGTAEGGEGPEEAPVGPAPEKAGLLEKNASESEEEPMDNDEENAFDAFEVARLCYEGSERADTRAYVQLRLAQLHVNLGRAEEACTDADAGLALAVAPADRLHLWQTKAHALLARDLVVDARAAFGRVARILEEHADTFEAKPLQEWRTDVGLQIEELDRAIQLADEGEQAEVKASKKRKYFANLEKDPKAAKVEPGASVGSPRANSDAVPSPGIRSNGISSPGAKSDGVASPAQPKAVPHAAEEATKEPPPTDAVAQ